MGNLELEWRKAFLDLDSRRIWQVDDRRIVEEGMFLDREGRSVMGGRSMGDYLAGDISNRVIELVLLQPT